MPSRGLPRAGSTASATRATRGTRWDGSSPSARFRSHGCGPTRLKPYARVEAASSATWSSETCGAKAEARKPRSDASSADDPPSPRALRAEDGFPGFRPPRRRRDASALGSDASTPARFRSCSSRWRASRAASSRVSRVSSFSMRAERASSASRRHRSVDTECALDGVDAALSTLSRLREEGEASPSEPSPGRPRTAPRVNTPRSGVIESSDHKEASSAGSDGASSGGVSSARADTDFFLRNMTGEPSTPTGFRAALTRARACPASGRASLTCVTRARAATSTDTSARFTVRQLRESFEISTVNRFRGDAETREAESPTPDGRLFADAPATRARPFFAEEGGVRTRLDGCSARLPRCDTGERAIGHVQTSSIRRPRRPV